MNRRRRRVGAGAIVREVREQGDRIIAPIREASAEQNASREAMAASLLNRGAGFLCAALDEGMPRTMVVHRGGDETPRTVTLEPPAAHDAGEGEPLESGQRK